MLVGNVSLNTEVIQNQGSERVIRWTQYINADQGKEIIVLPIQLRTNLLRSEPDNLMAALWKVCIQMSQNDKIQLFEDKRIRTAWDEEKEEWFFSIVDVVAVLTDQQDQRGASNYWAKLKQRLKEEGADQLLTN